MLFLSWNVNGLRACLNKGFAEFVLQSEADIVAIQETKAHKHQVCLTLPSYQIYFNSAEKKGYAGTAVLTRKEPLRVHYGIGEKDHDQEGRVITLEFADFYFVTVYTPNAQRELARLSYRMTWEDAFRRFVCSLDQKKKVVLCGDLNVAHQEIDLKNPQNNRRHAGFTDEERGKFSELLAAGFCDTFRMLYPDARHAYTWWSYLRDARSRNAGWRIDYFLVSQRMAPEVADARIYSDIMGSDHCPVGLLIK